jgi:hypothetical protein
MPFKLVGVNHPGNSVTYHFGEVPKMIEVAR